MCTVDWWHKPLQHEFVNKDMHNVTFHVSADGLYRKPHIVHSQCISVMLGMLKCAVALSSAASQGRA